MSLEASTMKPVDIKIALMKAEVTQAQIAKELEVSRASISLTIKGTSKSKRVRACIAKHIGKKTT